MATTGSLQLSKSLSHDLGLCRNQVYSNTQFKGIVGRRRRLPVLGTALSSSASLRSRDAWSIRVLDVLCRPVNSVSYRSNGFKCYSLLGPGQGFQFNGVKVASTALMRSYSFLQDSPLIFKLAPSVGMIAFAVWGLEPLMRMGRNIVFKKNDNNWKKSNTCYITTSYLRPLLLWTGAILVCRVVDPVVLPTEASQLVKQRLLNFVRSLSTVLAFAYCLSSFIQQTQKFFVESNEPGDARNMGFQFAGKAIYSAVWVAAVSLFMELLGFSTQKWLTAGGLGTVLLTLAGREIFTNFLSSAMIHATRPFVENEWIQTKLEGYEVSGTVEHVGWWSPTIVRGEDREAVHIPNHKFTVNVVRNLSQKSHWRIKTHLAISHLDVHKINNIVADMRKVLAKNPQVEQQRLHRRVFLDNINPENQALLILVSCFVKTTHHEEYLCVKEAILLDLLRVISHHRARLATPIRTVQKIYGDADLENVPFSDSVYNRGGVASNRPLLLIEPSYRINGDDKSKSQNRSGRVVGEQDNKGTSKSSADTKAGTADTKAGGSAKSDTKAKETTKRDTKADSKMGQIPNSDVKEQAKSSANSSLKTNSNNTESRNSNSDMAASTPGNLNQNNGAPDSKQLKRVVSENTRQTTKSDNPSAETGVNKKGGLRESSPSKQETQRKPVSQPSTSRPVLEENIVLGVALEGSKRTLPIDEDNASHPTSGERELTVADRNGTGSLTSEKNRKDGQLPIPPAAADDH